MFVALLCGVMTLSAQKPFAGRIQYETTVEGTDDPNVVSSFAGITTEYLVMGNNMKKVISVQGFGQIEITNGDYNVIYNVLDISAFNMGKYFTEVKGDELQKELAKNKMDYEYTQETREIAGYSCKKVIATVTDQESDEESKVVFWVTNDLNVGDNINFATAPGLKGFPLRTETDIEMGDETITMIQTASLVKADKKVKAADFYRPSDATPMDEMPDEVKAQLGLGD